MVAPLAALGLSVAGDVIGGIAKKAVSGATSSAASALSAASGNTDKLRKTAKDFETVFLEQTLERLSQNSGDAGPLGGGDDGGNVYKSMLVKEYAGKIVQSGGVGIADSVYAQMLKMQEGR